MLPLNLFNLVSSHFLWPSSSAKQHYILSCYANVFFISSVFYIILLYLSLANVFLFSALFRSMHIKHIPTIKSCSNRNRTTQAILILHKINGTKKGTLFLKVQNHIIIRYTNWWFLYCFWYRMYITTQGLTALLNGNKFLLVWLYRRLPSFPSFSPYLLATKSI